MTDASERATKKQQELLEFVASFINEHDYGPSYREIMGALGYKSVSTVAVHIDGLIAKGFLAREDNSARSLVVISESSSDAKTSPSLLVHEATRSLSDVAKEKRPIIFEALELLGHEKAAKELRDKYANTD